VEIREEVRDAEEIYPAVPNPATVEIKLLACPTPMTVETIVDCNSVGSIKLLIYFSKPAVVETRDDWRDAEEIYPREPNPKAKAIRLAPEMKPAVLNSVLIPPVVDNKFS